ncbi:MAG: ABC transporter substrate-binding protein [Alphaproteobacteria bacterium]|nr:ABC transporter substrate-binding protein [Alphaproteobacteria bacterium]
MTLPFVPSLLMALAGCTGGPAATPDAASPAPEAAEAPAAAPIPVRLALNWFPEPEFGGFYQGVLDGTYAKAGFDVTILPGGPGAPSLELMVAGNADAAITVADDLLLKRSKGVAAVGAWPAFQLAPNGLMVHAGGPSSFDQITGGTVAIELGSPFQTFLWKTYAWDGKVQAVPYGGAIGPFLADATLIQQAYITAEPCLAKARGAEVQFLKASDAGWNPYATVLAFADPPPAWAKDFVVATQTAWEAYVADPAKANAELVRLNDQLQPDLMDCIVQAQTPFLTGSEGLGHQSEARWEKMAASLVDLGLLPAGSTAKGAWVELR